LAHLRHGATSRVDVERTLRNRSGGRCNSGKRSFHWGLVVGAVPLGAAIRQRASKRSAAFQQRPHRPRRAPHRLARGADLRPRVPRAMHALHVGRALRHVRGRDLLGRNWPRRLWQSEKALKEQTGAHPRFALRPRFAAGQRPTAWARCLRTKPLACRPILESEGIVDFPGRRFGVWSARAPQKKID
jgi:hypothetical protein